MDFFEQQDKARKKTKVLVVYFVLAILCIVVSVYVAVVFIMGGIYLQQDTGTGAGTGQFPLWDPTLFAAVAVGTLVVVFLGSAYKTLSLAAGGSAVATALGGRLVGSNTTHPEEQRLRNVVEEMAIASGIPVPKIYILDGERGINAFAAGHSLDDAAVGVTSGCLTQLSRDELQGVIGHEFSHILNGDMRLNIRLMGILFGILCLAVIGRVLLYSARGSRERNPLPFLGLALMLIGWIGVFFGRLIQAALSRQREFLADAAAVQFTRNPAGLSGALKKIGGASSQLDSAHAAEASHMFFGNGLGNPFFGALATHPPLETRIRAIDPSWDGKFTPRSATRQAPPDLPTAKKRQSSPPLIPGFPGAGEGAAGLAAGAVQMGAVLPGLGRPTPAHVRYAEALRESFPESIQAAAHDPLDAMALLYAMLLSDDGDLRATQLAALEGRAAPGISEKAAALRPEVAPVITRARLPLVNLALPALRQLRPDEMEEFTQALDWLIESDGKIDLFEFTLQKIVRRHLLGQSWKGVPKRDRYRALRPLLGHCSVVLSALAYTGSRDPGEIEKAFQAGASHLGSAGRALRLLPRAGSGLVQIDSALDEVALAVPQLKKKVIEACAEVAGADGVIHEREAELLRAIAETLECPIPPFLDADDDGD